MKKTLLLTAALLGGIVLPAVAFADGKVIFECEMRPIPGTNAWQRVDPTCPGFDGPKGTIGLVNMPVDDGDDDPEDPVDPVDPIEPEEPGDEEPEEPGDDSDPNGETETA